MNLFKSWIGKALLAGLFAILSAGAVLSLLYCSWSAPVRMLCIGSYGVAVVAVVLRLRPWRKTCWGLLAVFGVVVVANLLMFPSNDRDWATSCKRLASADIVGDKVTFYNVRNFDYSSATNFVPRHYDKTFDLTKLESQDVYLVNWGIPYISHTMVSFGFGDEGYLCFSFETRKEKGEGYSAIQGFFRKYELYCVVGDERDLVRLRTTYRDGENVYLYRLQLDPGEDLRPVFLAYIDMVNGLSRQPDWYNAISDNCMTAAYKLARMNQVDQNRPWHWKILLNGYADELAYERGRIDTRLPFEEMKERCLINDQAQAAGESDEFSHLIRAGVPGIASQPSQVDALP